MTCLLWVEDSCARQPLHCFVRGGEGTSYVSRLIDQTGFLQKLICHTSLLFLTQSSAFPKSFTPMGIFEFDKLHCLHGDKREQSDSYLSPETPWQPDMHLSRAASTWSLQKAERKPQRTMNAIKPGDTRQFAKTIPSAQWSTGPDKF